MARAIAETLLTGEGNASAEKPDRAASNVEQEQGVGTQGASTIARSRRLPGDPRKGDPQSEAQGDKFPKRPLVRNLNVLAHAHPTALDGHIDLRKISIASSNGPDMTSNIKSMIGGDRR